MFVHRQQVSGLLAAADQRATACLPGQAHPAASVQGSGLDEIAERQAFGCRDRSLSASSSIRSSCPGQAVNGRIRRGPSMYEMEGPRPASLRQADQLPGFAGAARRPPVPDTRARDRFPGSSHVPGVAPRWCPFPTVKAFLLPPRARAQDPAASKFRDFRHPHGIHRKCVVIRTWQWLSTGLLTAYPQVTGRNSGITESCRRRM
jgi:hypothetical protein